MINLASQQLCEGQPGGQGPGPGEAHPDHLDGVVDGRGLGHGREQHRGHPHVDRGQEHDLCQHFVCKQYYHWSKITSYSQVKIQWIDNIKTHKLHYFSWYYVYKYKSASDTIQLVMLLYYTKQWLTDMPHNQSLLLQLFYEQLQFRQDPAVHESMPCMSYVSISMVWYGVGARAQRWSLLPTHYCTPPPIFAAELHCFSHWSKVSIVDSLCKWFLLRQHGFGYPSVH